MVISTGIVAGCRINPKLQHYYEILPSSTIMTKKHISNKEDTSLPKRTQTTTSRNSQSPGRRRMRRKLCSAIFYCLFILLVFAPINAQDEVIMIQKCENDAHCYSDAYCLDGHCESCVSCEQALNRETKPNLIRDCAKSFKDCSTTCVKGYSSYDIINDEQSENCILNETDQKSNNQKLIIALAVPVLISFIVFIFYTKSDGCKRIPKEIEDSKTAEQDIPKLDIIVDMSPTAESDASPANHQEADVSRASVKEVRLETSV